MPSTETSSAVEPELELMLCKTLLATLNRTLLVQQEFIQQILTELLLKTRDTKLVPVPNSTFKTGEIGKKHTSKIYSILGDDKCSGKK